MKLDASTTRLPIDQIAIGKRHRKDYGDIEGLARSIRESGIVQPIAVRPNGELVAGERRLRAAILAGETEIPVFVVDIDVITGEFIENVYRKAFTPSELVDIGGGD
jgi:ParB family chromosome partitioning protein